MLVISPLGARREVQVSQSDSQINVDAGPRHSFNGNMPPMLHVEVRMMSGSLVARLAANPCETIGALKRRILWQDKNAFDDSGDFSGSVFESDRTLSGRQNVSVAERPLPAEIRLIAGKVWLMETQQICEVESAEGEDTGPDRQIYLTLVRVRAFGLAAQVEKLESFNQDTYGMAEYAESVFRNQHMVASRHWPDERDVSRTLHPAIRTQLVAWLIAACEATRINEFVLHGAVLTLDRYAAARKHPIREDCLCVVVLAALSAEIKFAMKSEFPDGYWQRVLLHLGDGRITWNELLEAETRLLQQVQFVVGTPSPCVFLTELGLRYGGRRRRSEGLRLPAKRNDALRMAFAQMLLELAMHETETLYRYLPVILAAGALGVAILAVADSCAENSVNNTRENVDEVVAAELADDEDVHTMKENLLDDLYSFCPRLDDRAQLVEDCENDIIQLWAQSTSGTFRGECLQQLVRIHANRKTGDDMPLGEAFKALKPPERLTG
eukprot:TRINITY_DN12775_c0_g1_i1.p1 TRINITY_DN12775_c0_g1~~TRINITY_DN12775_c0_g1_i1.p1  ORF type:complete len:496 (-),score=63.60 TRINITY_DN12775_c0_g1_i1:617-2104(-)